jgi:c-di-GMP-related signal transduction protein
MDQVHVLTRTTGTGRGATTIVMGQEKSSDLVLSSLVRARFCELLGAKVKHGGTDLFLVGMLSLMDVLLEVPIGMLIEDLKLDPDIKDQLLSAKTSTQTALSPIYDLMVAREAGDWGTVTNSGQAPRPVARPAAPGLQRSHALITSAGK